MKNNNSIIVFIIFITILFNGCGREISLIQNKEDLKKYIKPNNKIIILSQGCSDTRSDSIKRAKHNFSLQISSNIKSQLVKTTNYSKNYYQSNVKYTFEEMSSYRKLIGIKYYNEPVFKVNNNFMYCTSVYYDFDYLDF